VSSASLAVEWVPIGKVFLSPSNPRVNDAAVEHVAASIRRFSWQQPLVAKPTGEVIAGNTRLKAAKSLGMDRVPVVWFEGTDLEATAYQVADNKTSEFASWDEPALAKILEHLRAEDALEGVGFSSGDIDDLLARLEAELGPGEGEDPGAGELPENPVTRKGDLWLLGTHRLLCGDSAAPEDLDRLLAGAPVHLVNTDPPYGVKVEPRSNNAIAAGLSSFTGTSHHQSLDLARHPSKATPTSKLRAKDRPLQNDFLPADEFARLLRAWFGNAARVLLPGRGFYIWGGYGNLGNYPPALAESGLYFSQGIVWDKCHPVLTRKDFMGAFEICFYGWKEGAAHEFFGPNNATDLWEVKKVNPQSMVHLTEKPVELAARAILYSSRAGEHVLDLFGGSGSTLVAAEQTRRRAFLMEIDEPYCDVIVERWQRASGTKALLEGTDKFFEEIAAERRMS
jgi:DNA modification methylase